MSVALLHEAYEALNRHDLDTLVALSDPDMEFLPLLLELEGTGPLQGLEDMRCWFDDLLGAFPTGESTSSRRARSETSLWPTQ